MIKKNDFGDHSKWQRLFSSKAKKNKKSFLMNEGIICDELSFTRHYNIPESEKFEFFHEFYSERGNFFFSF